MSTHPSKQMFLKYSSTVNNGYNYAARCIKVIVPREEEGKKPLVAQFGGIPLRRNRNAVLRDYTLTRYTEMRSDAVTWMRAGICEMCDARGLTQMHHIHVLKDLNVKGQRPKKPWVMKMAAMGRKQLVVCIPCHQDITYGRF